MNIDVRGWDIPKHTTVHTGKPKTVHNTTAHTTS